MTHLTDQQVRDERVEFEKWASARGFRLDRNGDYFNQPKTEAAWQAWLHRASELLQARAERDHHANDRDRPARTPEESYRFVNSDHPCCLPIGDVAHILEAWRTAERSLQECRERESKYLELLLRFCDFAPNCGQLLDGWYPDGTAWSAWDEQVRRELVTLHESVRSALVPRPAEPQENTK